MQGWSGREENCWFIQLGEVEQWMNMTTRKEDEDILMKEKIAQADYELNQVIKQNKLLTNDTTNISKQSSQVLQEQNAVFRIHLNQFLNEVVAGS